MKIQCGCGAKYEFEITPEMAQNPLQFVCPACGADSSALVTSLVRQQLGQASGAGILPASPAPRAPRLQVPPQTTPPDTAPPLETQPRRCPRHPAEFAVEKCAVCSKPICPKCMELFGYVCGPLCKAKAEAQGRQVPSHAALKSAVEARLWRNVGRIATISAVVMAAALGFWIWYAWFGSVPKVAFSTRFAEPAYSGQSAFAAEDQLVFLHGSLLARYDLKADKEIWSRQLLDEKEMDAATAIQFKELEQANERVRQSDPDNVPKTPSPDRLKLRLERMAAAALDLRVYGRNIWVISPVSLVHYDWETGKPDKEVALPPGAGGVLARGDELLLVAAAHGGEPCMTRINLANCDSRTETLDGRAVTNALAAAQPPGRRAGAFAGLPVGLPGKDSGKPMDPAKVARQAQHLSYPARIALTAVLASSRSQERALAEMRDSSPRSVPADSPATPAETLSLIPTQDGFLQFSVRLLERRIVARSTMKAPPAKSALNGTLSLNRTADAANEILNDMQRERGGDVVQEDQSRYVVKLQPPGSKEGWSAEVVGPPSLFCLRTVNVVTANKMMVVLDKANSQLWQSTLSYNVSPNLGAGEGENGRYGQGPCVEHNGGLYVFDQGELVAFDLASGTRRWGLPSVGIAGLFFDDQDNIYVSSTTAGLDSIKYSRQIDISQKARPVVFKIDSRTGKTLWTQHPDGLLSYVSGKFLYTVQSYMPEEPDEDGPPPVQTGFETPPSLRITRLSPRTGAPLWEHSQERAPLDVQFDRNRIRLVFKKEVQVLKYLSF
ncbi:MAG TPA: PQQ-binding-like beta-propeller repeat protein [Dongiaceae bacterium]|nr:PQQ-binding-like beta-propeller repeat protein [Dongiaceae bacterium]